MTTESRTTLPDACPKCGVAKVENVRQEHGTKGDWWYWWVEFLECQSCGVRMFPAKEQAAAQPI